MILVDTSVWVDHLRIGDLALARLLDQGLVLTHPFVLGELALGDMRQRSSILTALAGLPRAVVASDTEVLAFISARRLHGRGVGYIDLHLLAAAQLTHGATLLTNDRRLNSVATELGLSAAR